MFQCRRFFCGAEPFTQTNTTVYVNVLGSRACHASNTCHTGTQGGVSPLLLLYLYKYQYCVLLGSKNDKYSTVWQILYSTLQDSTRIFHYLRRDPTEPQRRFGYCPVVLVERIYRRITVYQVPGTSTPLYVMSRAWYRTVLVTVQVLVHCTHQCSSISSKTSAFVKSTVRCKQFFGYRSTTVLVYSTVYRIILI